MRNNTNPGRIKTWSINIGMILIAYAGMQLWMSRATPDGVAPTIQGVTLDGQAFDLYAPRERPILVHFWATWCTICRIEQGGINDIAADHPIITIASQSGSLEQIAATVKERNITAPVLVDPGNNIANVYGIKAFPTSFIVDTRGNIVFREVGLTSEWGLRLRLWWAEIIS